MKQRIIIVLLAVGLTLALSACSEANSNTQAKTNIAPPQKAAKRSSNFSYVAEGGRLFQQHCAQCHGADGQGAPNWRQREPDGLFPPPPLNGSGHAWHHPSDWLFAKIKYGSVPGQGKMPAWGETLSDEQIKAVMAWFMAKWSPEVYEAWSRMERQAKR